MNNQIRLYMSKEIEIDFNTLQLIFFFVPKHIMFENQGFIFDSNYKIDVVNYNSNIENYCFELNISNNQNYYNLFKNANASFKVICGKNGTGKTTLGKLITNTFFPYRPFVGVSDDKDIISPITIKDYSNIILYRDFNGNFLSSVPVIINYNGNKIILDKETQISNQLLKFLFIDKNEKIKDFKSNFLEEYILNENIFHGIVDNKPLFNSFKFTIPDINKRIQEIALYSLEGMFDGISGIGYRTFYNQMENNLFLIYLFELFTKAEFKNLRNIFLQNYKKQNDVNKENQMSFIDKYFEKKDSILYQQILKRQDKLLNHVYPIQDYKIRIKELNILYDEINRFIKKLLNIQFDYTWYIKVDELIYKEGIYSYTLNNIRTLNDLSSGEYNNLFYRYQLLSIFTNNYSCVVIDEPEAGLHPEWCRTFFSDFLNTYEQLRIKLNDNRKRLFIFLTHSPFLLSDITNDYIIYLDKDEKGFTYEKKISKDTFAGNIGEMYCTNMFMDNTIGEFARQKLLHIVKDLDSNKKIDDIQLKSYKKLISKVGDNLLRNLLEDKVNIYEKNNSYR